jgi:hypothetical protein
MGDRAAGTRVYVGNLNPGVEKAQLEDTCVWRAALP